MKRLIGIFILGVAVLWPLAGQARSNVFVGANFGYPGYYYSPYPRYHGYYGPPAYYYPPPVYYAPPPVYYAPPPVYYAPTVSGTISPSNCRVFRGDASIDASGQPFYGTACLLADGRWHIR